MGADSSVEIESGSARLNHYEHALKDAIGDKRARWREYRVPPLSPVPAPRPNPSDDAEGGDATGLA